VGVHTYLCPDIFSLSLPKKLLRLVFLSLPVPDEDRLGVGFEGVLLLLPGCDVGGVPEVFVDVGWVEMPVVTAGCEVP